jgi:hypothetical protein
MEHYFMVTSGILTGLLLWMTTRSYDARVKLFRIKRALNHYSDPGDCVAYLKGLLLDK